MKHRWTTFTLVLVALVAFTGPALAYWIGGGDGTNWSDSANWSDGAVPLTPTGATGAYIPSANAPGTNDLYIVLDAATANTFVDGVNANILRTSMTTSDRDMTVMLDWGNSHTNGGFWPGGLSGASYTNSFINHIQTGGNLALYGASYIGRSSPAGLKVVYDVQGGSLGCGILVLGCRTDTRSDATLRLSGGTFDNITPDTWATRRILMSGHEGGVSTIEVSGPSTFMVHDFRMGGKHSGDPIGGSTYFRVIGSEATILFDLNWNFDYYNIAADQLTNQVEWIADAGGVSAITGYDTAATWRPNTNTTAVIDLTDYAGTDDLVLARFGRHNSTPFGGVTIIDPLNRGYVLVQDPWPGYTEAPGVIIRLFLTLTPPQPWIAMSASGGVASMTYAGPTFTGAIYKLMSTMDLTDYTAWTPTGLELVGNGGDLIFTNDADAAIQAYGVSKK